MMPGELFAQISPTTTMTAPNSFCDNLACPHHLHDYVANPNTNMVEIVKAEMLPVEMLTEANAHVPLPQIPISKEVHYRHLMWISVPPAHLGPDYYYFCDTCCDGVNNFVDHGRH